MQGNEGCGYFRWIDEGIDLKKNSHIECRTHETQRGAIDVGIVELYMRQHICTLCIAVVCVFLAMYAYKQNAIASSFFNVIPFFFIFFFLGWKHIHSNKSDPHIFMRLIDVDISRIELTNKTTEIATTHTRLKYSNTKWCKNHIENER